MGHLLQSLFAAFNLMFVSVSECVCFITDEFYQYQQGKERNCHFFVPNCPNSHGLCWSFLINQYHLLAASFINKQVKPICCYCFTSICNWWYQGELGFCWREAELCINVYGRSVSIKNINLMGHPPWNNFLYLVLICMCTQFVILIMILWSN